MKKIFCKKNLSLFIIILLVACVCAISYYICKPMLLMVDDPAKFQDYISQKGFVAVAAFMLSVVLQVIVAFIPGGPFQVAAGYAFGSFKGALLVDVAASIGSIIVFLFVKKYGMSFIRLFFSEEQINSVKFLKNTKRLEIVLFILFLIPGTPKDLISYGVGLTDVKLKNWAIITLIGRFPAILMSTYGGSSVAIGRLDIFIGIMLVFGVLALIGSYFYLKWSKKQR